MHQGIRLLLRGVARAELLFQQLAPVQGTLGIPHVALFIELRARPVPLVLGDVVPLLGLRAVPALVYRLRVLAHQRQLDLPVLSAGAPHAPRLGSGLLRFTVIQLHLEEAEAQLRIAYPGSFVAVILKRAPALHLITGVHFMGPIGLAEQLYCPAHIHCDLYYIAVSLVLFHFADGHVFRLDGILLAGMSVCTADGDLLARGDACGIEQFRHFLFARSSRDRLLGDLPDLEGHAVFRRRGGSQVLLGDLGTHPLPLALVVGDRHRLDRLVRQLIPLGHVLVHIAVLCHLGVIAVPDHRHLALPDALFRIGLSEGDGRAVLRGPPVDLRALPRAVVRVQLHPHIQVLTQHRSSRAALCTCAGDHHVRDLRFGVDAPLLVLIHQDIVHAPGRRVRPAERLVQQLRALQRACGIPYAVRLVELRVLPVPVALREEVLLRGLRAVPALVHCVRVLAHQRQLDLPVLSAGAIHAPRLGSGLLGDVDQLHCQGVVVLPYPSLAVVLQHPGGALTGDAVRLVRAIGLAVEADGPAVVDRRFYCVAALRIPLDLSQGDIGGLHIILYEIRVIAAALDAADPDLPSGRHRRSVEQLRHLLQGREGGHVRWLCRDRVCPSAGRRCRRHCSDQHDHGQQPRQPLPCFHSIFPPF